MKPKNCYCFVEKEITCTTCDGDYEEIELPKEEPIHVPPRNEEEKRRLDQFNENMKEICPNFKPWPVTEKGYRQMIHEQAAALCSGIDNLNFAKALVGEKTPNKEELIKMHELVKNAGYGSYTRGLDGKPKRILEKRE